mgnify:CR=1 FL=1
MLDIKITRTTTPKEKPTGKLGFGRVFTDHMFVMNYTKGKGWHDPRIVPYEDITLSPAAMVFHYGQEMFEGLKAYKGDDGANYLFRPDMNAKRTNDTNDRLCIPRVPVEDYVQAVKAIVSVDQDWIPTEPGTSLYIRPFIIATEPFLGVVASETFLFITILPPVPIMRAAWSLWASGSRTTTSGPSGAAWALPRPAATTLPPWPPR